MLKFNYLISLLTIINGYELSDLLTNSVNSLKINLLKNYNRDTIPIKEKPLNLSLGIILNSIDDVTYLINDIYCIFFVLIILGVLIYIFSF